MNNNNIKYRQCYWHSNGDLECKDLPSNKPQNIIEFINFSTPNSNYNPNAYRKNIKYYETANNYVCNDINSQCKQPEKDNYRWLSSPQTKQKKEYLLNTKLNDNPNYIPN